MSEFYEYRDSRLYAHYSRTEKPIPESFYMHMHEGCELYCFFGGHGTYKIEGTDYPLEHGDILIVRPYESHYIDIKPDSPYTRFAAHFDLSLFSALDPEGVLSRPFMCRASGKGNLYRKSDFPSGMYNMCMSLLTRPVADSGLSVFSALIPLLYGISAVFENRKSEPETETLDRKIINYINSNITEELSLDGICEAFYLSKPQLCRLFKNATGSTVWEYVTAKRLALARELLKSGGNAVQAAADCGFGDYSAFYRAYRKKYGSSPSETVFVN